MRHLRLIVLVAGAAALVALCAPVVALAGTYSWSQPGDFSGTQGALKYGQPSWDYDAGSPPSQSLRFSSGQWSDASGDSISTSGGNRLNVPTGTMTLSPGAMVSATLGARGRVQLAALSQSPPT